MLEQNALTGACKGQIGARQLLDEARVGAHRIEQGNFMPQCGAHGLETLKLASEQCCSLLEPPAGIETVLAVNGVKPEVTCHAAAKEQNQSLPLHTHSIFSLTLRETFVARRSNWRHR